MRGGSNVRILVVLSLIIATIVLSILLSRGRVRDTSRLSAPSAVLDANGRSIEERPTPTRTPEVRALSSPPERDAFGAGTICGFGHVAGLRGDPDAEFQFVASLTQGVGSRWVSALQNSGDLEARAAGLLLEVRTNNGADSAQTRNALVQLAVGTTDPAVYAMAIALCGSESGTDSDSECHGISLQRWAQIDPGNAVPWLLLADDARKRHNIGEEASAFSKAAKSTSVNSYSDSLYAFAEPDLPPDTTPLERAYLATMVSGVEAAMSSPEYTAANLHCSVGAMQDNEVSTLR